MSNIVLSALMMMDNYMGQINRLKHGQFHKVCMDQF